ncbi:MAG: hypothetical protein AAFR64_06215 [Pseudomonadota bacterium]
MFRNCLALSLFAFSSAAYAEAEGFDAQAPLEDRLAYLESLEAPLDALRGSLIECGEGCLTPSEAVLLAFDAGDGESRPGRFLLDIRGGGQSLTGNLGQLFFVNSRQDYAEFGTLTIAFEDHVLNALLRRARTCNATSGTEQEISVQGCRQKGISDVNMFTMMQALFRRRIVVDGDVRLQWIDSRFGLRPREGAERGYYQPWVWVQDADQISFVYED